MFCRKCGKENPDGVWKCASCKEPLIPIDLSPDELDQQYMNYAHSQWRGFVKSPMVLILLILQSLALVSSLALGLLAGIVMPLWLLTTLIMNLGPILVLVAMWRIYGETVGKKPVSTKGIDMLASLFNIIRWFEMVAIIVSGVISLTQAAALRAAWGGSGLGGTYTSGVTFGVIISLIIAVWLINFVFKSYIEFLSGIQRTIRGERPVITKGIFLAVVHFLLAIGSGVSSALQPLGGLIQTSNGNVASAVASALIGIVILLLQFKITGMTKVYDAYKKQSKAIRSFKVSSNPEAAVNFDNLPTWKKVELLKQQEQANQAE